MNSPWSRLSENTTGNNMNTWVSLLHVLMNRNNMNLRVKPGSFSASSSSGSGFSTCRTQGAVRTWWRFQDSFGPQDVWRNYFWCFHISTTLFSPRSWWFTDNWSTHFLQDVTLSFRNKHKHLHLKTVCRISCSDRRHLTSDTFKEEIALHLFN